MAVRPRRPTDPAAAVWLYLCHLAGVKPRLATRVWRQFEQQPESLPLRYAFATALAAGPPSSSARLRAAADLVEGQGSPLSVVAALEGLVRTKRLSRAEANVVEEALLTLISHAGRWK